MNPLQLALIEKYGNDNGFEYVLVSGANGVTLASARHPARALVSIESDAYRLQFQSASTTLCAELERSFPQFCGGADRFTVQGEAALAALLRRAASLARALPNQAVTDFQQAIATELSTLPTSVVGTEVERLVRQRVGQDCFRAAMLDYWGGACAVTGVSVPEVLRASHAKPWAECASDAERLDVFNGFLLTANLDALFDRFLIGFDQRGILMTSPRLSSHDMSRLGISTTMRLRWLAEHHHPYLNYQRERLLGPAASN